MGLYTKIDKQIDKNCEVVSINKSSSKQNFYMKSVVLLLFVFNVLVVIKRFIKSMHNPVTFFWLIFLLDLSVFISSKTLESGNLVFFSEKKPIHYLFVLFLYPYLQLYIPLYSLPVQRLYFWIKALCPLLDCVEYDSLLFYLMVCDISFCTLESFSYKFY